MTIWLVAIVGGVLLALLSYRLGTAATGRALPAMLLRAVAFTLLLALLLDAAAGAARPVPPIVALDVSASWTRAADSAAWVAARRRADEPATDTLFLVGDSVRAGEVPARPADAATRVRPLVERSLAAGRPLQLVTDGEVDDPDALSGLPTGSQIVVVDRASGRDAAIAEMQSPRAVIGNDTVEVRIEVAAGSAGSGAGTVTLTADAQQLASLPVEALAPFGERALTTRVRMPNVAGPTLVRVVIASAGDVEPRNDTLAVVIEVSPAAGAVLVSTSPDLDAREALALLRGALALPTRGFYRVAPGVWRQDGSLAPAAESEIRALVRDAPLVVLHGDTAVFGPPRAATRGALALLAPPPEGPGEWYAVGAPASPISATLSAVVWDSLPPLDVAANLPPAEWVGLETRRSRRLERRVAIVGSESPRRVAIVGASGFWRWRFRGGVSADAYAALWGGLFDWLSAGRSDVRAAVPADAIVHAGDPVRWRRGAGDDSVVTLTLARRGAGASVDTMTLHFPTGEIFIETAPLGPGLYDVQTTGGASLLAVNPTRELYPRRPSVRSGAVGRGAALSDAPRLRSFGWVYVIVVAALCAEWLLRRRLGMR